MTSLRECGGRRGVGVTTAFPVSKPCAEGELWSDASGSVCPSFVAQAEAGTLGQALSAIYKPLL